MQHAPAPFHADLAEGPAGAAAYWVHAADDVRLRMAHYPSDGTSGTVLMFPGRTEYVEKYGRVAADLSRAGYHMLTIDWRGQGLADRLLHDPRTGHVHVFEDYQTDVAAALALAHALGLPEPFHLIGHSMGGCIGLRALVSGLPVATAVFTGPMWGIRMAAPVRPAAWALSWGSARAGLGHLFAPGTGANSYVATEAFEGNTLTTDRDGWSYMRRQVEAVPELQLGGPSLHWLHEALAECRALARLPSPALPSLCFVGSNERIVDVARIEDRMARWPSGALEVIEGGEHEVLMEDAVTRARILAQCCALFDGVNGSNGASLTA